MNENNRKNRKELWHITEYLINRFKINKEGKQSWDKQEPTWK